MSENWLQEAIDRQRVGLSARLALPLARIAERCAGIRGINPGVLDRLLADSIGALSPCHLLYIISPTGVLLSANVSPDHVDVTVRGQNLSNRPYLVSSVPDTGFLLSDVYVSRVTARPCVTAVHAVTKTGQGIIGYLAADFALRDLPLLAEPDVRTAGARQIKGDPSIRATVFNQRRTDSDMDRSMPEVIAIMDELLGERGVFHAKLNFSSSRATLWLTDDPYRYRVHVLQEIVDPAVCFAYPQQPYSDKAIVSRDSIGAVFDRLALLRTLDDTIYLRSGSLNIINGMVGLTFSCDGSYYLPTDEFLAKDECYWLGA